MLAQALTRPQFGSIQLQFEPLQREISPKVSLAALLFEPLSRGQNNREKGSLRLTETECNSKDRFCTGFEFELELETLIREAEGKHARQLETER